MNSITCPFCALSIPAGTTSCPNCGGFLPVSGSSGGDRPSARPGGLDFAPPPSIGEPPRSSNFGAPPSSSGFGAPPSSSGFGAPPPSSGFGAPPPSSSFGAAPPSGVRPPPPGPVFGAPPPMGAFPQGGAASQSRAGRNLVIGIVIAVVVLFLVMCGGGMAAYWLARGSGGASDSAAQLIAVNTPVSGDITFSRDAQVYEFTLTQAGMVTITVTGDFDNYLELYRGTESSPFMEDDDSGGSLNASISTTLTPGTYYARVRAYNSGTTGHFTVTVSAPAEQAFTNPGPNPGWGVPPQPVPPTQPFPPPVVPSYPGVVQPQTFQGTVSSVGGVAPVSAGAQCTVDLTAESGGSNLNCRVNVTCGGTVLYGGAHDNQRFGYVHCDVSDLGGRQAVVAHDTNPTDTEGDPMIDLDTSAGTIVVSDRVRGAEWNARIQFSGQQTSI